MVALLINRAKRLRTYRQHVSSTQLSIDSNSTPLS
jgi:hypothetical protein